MRTKEIRLNKIRSCMNLAENDLTISEIHKWILEYVKKDIGRKTIQRDIIEMITRGEIIQKGGFPSRFKLSKATNYNIELNLHEVDLIIELLSNNPAIQKKISRQIMTKSLSR